MPEHKWNTLKSRFSLDHKSRRIFPQWMSVTAVIDNWYHWAGSHRLMSVWHCPLCSSPRWTAARCSGRASLTERTEECGWERHDNTPQLVRLLLRAPLLQPDRPEPMCCGMMMCRIRKNVRKFELNPIRMCYPIINSVHVKVCLDEKTQIKVHVKFLTIWHVSSSSEEVWD